MKGCLSRRVALVTGAGRGIGRQHAELLALEGASVAVNDVDATAAEATAAELIDQGLVAVAVHGDVSDWAQAHGIIETTAAAFGGLDILVNNAGLGGDTPISEMTEAEFDANVRVNLKGTYAPTRAAVAFWQARRAACQPVAASVVSTSSGGGLLGNPGQTHYGAAKAAVAAFTSIAAMELAGTGIRLNAIAPAARTPMSGEGTDSVVARFMARPDDPNEFDPWHPANISPLVAYLSTVDCEITGEVFHVRGGVVGHFAGWTIDHVADAGRRWTVAELAQVVPGLVAASPSRSEAGGAAYAALRAELRNDRLSPEHPGGTTK